MASFQSIAAVGKSIERFLNFCYERRQPVPDKTTRAVLVRSEDFHKNRATNAIPVPGLSLWLYRVEVNRTMRAAWSAVANQDGQVHLPLDLHFLLTPWAENAEYEHLILGRTLQCLEANPVLSGPLLDSAGGWFPNEAVQLCLADVPMEEMMRTFDSLPMDYKLSVPYTVRVVRISEAAGAAERTVTTLAVGGSAGVRP